MRVTALPAEQPTPPDLFATTVMGRPGGRLLSGRFDPALAKLGQAGEEATAALLADLVTRLPNARVFHGIGEVGPGDVDVDHAVLVGDRVALIDSKMWAADAVFFDGKKLWADGRDHGHLSLLLTAPTLTTHLSAGRPRTVTATSYVVVHPTGRHATACSQTRAPSPVTLTSASGLLEHLLAFFAPAADVAPDRDVFLRLAALLIDPPTGSLGDALASELRDRPPAPAASSRGDLLGDLRAWRDRAATDEDRPTFTVLTDSILKGIAEQRPVTQMDLARVPGLGPAKISRYGADILAVVAAAGPVRR